MGVWVKAMERAKKLESTQYTHAVSRELAIAEHYYRPASPAMKKLIAMVVDAAR